MTRPRPFDQLLEAWLDDGPEVAPRDLLESVLVTLPTRRQHRRLLGAARRSPVALWTSRLAAVAAAVVVGAIGLSLVTSRGPSAGGPTASPPPGSSSGSPGVACPSVFQFPQFNVPLGGSMALCAVNSTVDFNWVWFRGQPGWTLSATDSGLVAYSWGADPKNGLIQVSRLGSVVGAGGNAAPVPANLMGWLRARSDLVLGTPTPLTVDSGSGAIVEGTVRAGAHATGRGVVTIACQAGLIPCTFDNPSALGIVTTDHFELAVLKDGSQQFLVELSADASAWATAKPKLEALLAAMMFPHPTG